MVQIRTNAFGMTVPCRVRDLITIKTGTTPTCGEEHQGRHGTSSPRSVDEDKNARSILKDMSFCSSSYNKTNLMTRNCGSFNIMDMLGSSPSSSISKNTDELRVQGSASSTKEVAEQRRGNHQNSRKKDKHCNCSPMLHFWVSSAMERFAKNRARTEKFFETLRTNEKDGLCLENRQQQAHCSGQAGSRRAAPSPGQQTLGDGKTQLVPHLSDVAREQTFFGEHSQFDLSCGALICQKSEAKALKDQVQGLGFFDKIFGVKKVWIAAEGIERMLVGLNAQGVEKALASSSEDANERGTFYINKDTKVVVVDAKARREMLATCLKTLGSPARDVEVHRGDSATPQTGGKITTSRHMDRLRKVHAFTWDKANFRHELDEKSPQFSVFSYLKYLLARQAQADAGAREAGVGEQEPRRINSLSAFLTSVRNNWVEKENIPDDFLPNFLCGQELGGCPWFEDLRSEEEREKNPVHYQVQGRFAFVGNLSEEFLARVKGGKTFWLAVWAFLVRRHPEVEVIGILGEIKNDDFRSPNGIQLFLSLEEQESTDNVHPAFKINFNPSTSIATFSSSTSSPRHGGLCASPGDKDFFWNKVAENGVLYTWHVLKTMFCKGNISEKLRVRSDDPQTGYKIEKDETVVDLFAGIGYWTLPILKQMGKEGKVYACEWNPESIEGLRRGYFLNFPTSNKGKLEMDLEQQHDHEHGQQQVKLEPNSSIISRLEILEGDCRLVAPKKVADRVILGLLPCTKDFRRTAAEALNWDKKENVKRLHIHQNLTAAELSSYSERVCSDLLELQNEIRNRDYKGDPSYCNFDVKVTHIAKVKSYAPKVNHYVFDVIFAPKKKLSSS
ncbi:unnamed protein product [Amoebophrya sp. A25]|nr:unnamed protein product [Amoebophrya sp. A25]|eukprot:GSA25T00005949001.1